MRCDIGNKMKSEQYHKYYMKVIDMNFKHCEAYCCMTYKCDKCNAEFDKPGKLRTHKETTEHDQE